jgi:lysozyme family protein
MSRFETCNAITAKWEGGWSDHPADPGGKTMYGVTEAVYHAWLKKQGKAIKPVRNITKAEALEIYRAQYWAPTAGKYNLVPGVDLATYDAGVNAGVSRAIKWLVQGASKGNDHVVTVKGICPGAAVLQARARHLEDVRQGLDEPRRRCRGEGRRDGTGLHGRSKARRGSEVDRARRARA